MVFKKILKNLAIFLGILIGIAFITLGCLYFIPNLTIFGIKFKKAGLKDMEYVNLASYEDACDSITLNLGHVNLDVVSASDNYRTTFSFELRDDARGLVKKDKDTLSYTVKLEDRNLIIDFTEPEGWIFWKDTWATLTISAKWLNSTDKKIITNTSNGKVSISTAAKASSTAAAINPKFSYVEFNSTGKGTFDISDPVENLKLHTGSGKSTVSGRCDKLTFISKKGELQFGNVGLLDARSNNSYVHGDVVAESFSYVGGDGKIEINQIGFDNFEAGTTISGGYISANISKVFGKIKTNTTKGEIKINSYASTSYYLNEIKTDKAKINVTNINSTKLALISNKGEINASASGSGELSITNGSGKTAFVGQNESGVAFNGAVNLTSKNGQINLSEISSAVTAETTGSGKINATFKVVSGNTSLKTNKGKITIGVPVTGSYVMNAQSVKKKVIASMPSLDISFKDNSHLTKVINIGGSDGSNVINLYAANADININQN